MYKVWNAANKQQWDLIYAKGYWPFVIERGIIIYGSFLAISMCVMTYFDYGENALFSKNVMYLFNLALASISGWFLTTCVWFVTAKSRNS